MDEFGFESESESEPLLSVGPIHPKLWEHWAWAGLGLALLLLCFLLWPPCQHGSCSMFQVVLNGPSLPLLDPLLELPSIYTTVTYLEMDHSEIVFYLCSTHTAMFLIIDGGIYCQCVSGSWGNRS